MSASPDTAPRSARGLGLRVPGLGAFHETWALTEGQPGLRLLAASGAVGALGTGLLSPVLPLLLQERGLSLGAIGVTYTAGSLLPVFLQPFVGELSDRTGRKRAILRLSLPTALLVPALAFVKAPVVLAGLLAFRVTLGQCQGPLFAALAGDLAPARLRGTVFALIESCTNVMFVVALVGSPTVLLVLGLKGAFLVSTALLLASSLMLLALEEIPVVRDVPAGTRRRGGARLLAVAEYARRQPELAAFFLYQFCFAFALGVYPVYLPLLASSLGTPRAWMGPLIASSWLVYALVQPAGGRLSDRRQRKGLILLGLGGMVLLSVPLGLAGALSSPYALPVLVAAWVLLAVPDGLFRPAIQALAVDVAPHGERGRFLGAVGTCVTFANVFSPLVYGGVAGRVGLSAAFLIASLAFAFALFAASRLHEPRTALR